MEVGEPVMDKLDYVETVRYILKNDINFNAKYGIYEGSEGQDKIVIVSKGYISDK